MKKSIIALAMLSAGITQASAQSNVTIYGIVDAGVTYVSNESGNRTSVEAGQMQVSRWGFKGVEDLGGGVKARFGLEGTLLNDTGGAGVGTGTPSSTSLFDREATVGLITDFGSIDIGRQNILGVQSVGMADPMGLAFAATSPNVLFSAMNNSAVYGPFGSNNGGTALRENNSVRYVSPNFRGLGFAVMRGFGEQPGDIQKNSYMGVSTFYTGGALSVGGAYARLKNNLGNDRLTSHAFGIKYTFPVVVLKSTYSENRLDSTTRKIKVFGVGADFLVAPAVTLTAAYYNTKRSGDANDKSQQLIGIAKYAFSKRTSAYVSIGRATTDTIVTATQINLAQGFVAIGSDKANRATTGVIHYF
jgi:predicted porin